MKKSINISQKWREITALLLLVNFFIAPLLNAFPQEKCDSACEMVMPFHDCNSDEMQMEDTCCDAMSNANSNSSSSASAECEMKVSDVNCSIVINDQLNTTYIVPKTIDNKVELVILPMFNVDTENSLSIVTANYAQEIFIDSSPPIYLMISSFLN